MTCSFPPPEKGLSPCSGLYHQSLNFSSSVLRIRDVGRLSPSPHKHIFSRYPVRLCLNP